MSVLKIEREGSTPPMLRIDVPSEFAEKAMVHTTDQRKAFAVGLAHAATLDIWEVFYVHGKRGFTNAGFVANMRLAR